MDSLSPQTVGCSVYDKFHIDFKYFSGDGGLPRSSGYHYHNTSEFLLVKSGMSSIIIGENVGYAEGSYLVFFAKQTPHCSVAVPEHEYSRYCFSVDEHYFSKDVELMSESFILPLTDDELDILLGPIELLFKFFSDIPTEYSSIMLKRREYLLLLFLEEVKLLLKKKNVTMITHKSYITSVCEYLSMHFNETVSLEQLSREFFVSKAKLTKDFKNKCGISVCDFIVTLRIRCAKKQLENNNAPIWKIAQDCGYQSCAYFVRQFSKATGMTPTQYRKTIMNEK